MSLNPKVTDLGNKIRLDWTPNPTSQGYRLYIDGVAVSRTFKPDATSATFAKPSSGSHRYGVRKMDVVGSLEEATWPAPTSSYIDKLSKLNAVFLPTWTPSASITQGVTNPAGLGGGVWEINDAAGSGFRFVSTPQMATPWQSDKKVCLAEMPIRPGVGVYETWRFKYRYPAADNPVFPHSWQGGTVFEFGHHATNSGLFIGLDGRNVSGDLGHILGVGKAPWGSGDFDYFTICPYSTFIATLGQDRLVEARIRYNADNTGYVRVKIDGKTIIDQSRPMRPNTSEIPKPQPGWYSDLGTTKNGVEIRNLEYAYGVA